jgi:hypothetical protein
MSLQGYNDPNPRWIPWLLGGVALIAALVYLGFV